MKPVGAFKILVLVLALPLFGQTFHYMKDFPLVWGLSKALPLLALPLAAFALLRWKPPYALQIALTFTVLVIVSCLTSKASFDQPLLSGLYSQVKLLPMLSFFGFLGLLAIVRPEQAELKRAVLTVGVVTALVTLGIWLVAPDSWYVTSIDVGEAPLLSHDMRGNRIRMPMFFVVIAFFYWLRLSVSDRSLRALVLAVLLFAFMALIVRTRAVIVAAALTGAIVLLRTAGPRLRLAAPVVIPTLATVIFSMPIVASMFQSDGNGYDIRRVTSEKAIAFLGNDWFTWVVGAGTINPMREQGMARFFNHYFFLADISWLGVIFEFGLLGALLLLLLPLRGILGLQRFVRRSDEPAFFGALQDYLIFVVVISPLYPVLTLQPGEVTILLAIAAYARLRSAERIEPIFGPERRMPLARAESVVPPRPF